MPCPLENRIGPNIGHLKQILFKRHPAHAPLESLLPRCGMQLTVSFELFSLQRLFIDLKLAVISVD